MSESSAGDTERSEPAEMELKDLREAYANLREESMSGLLDDAEWDWMEDAWNELRKRVDIQQPECPECGARNWGFGEHISCRACGRGTEFEEDDLRKEIQISWTAIIRGVDQSTKDTDRPEAGQ